MWLLSNHFIARLLQILTKRARNELLPLASNEKNNSKLNCAPIYTFVPSKSALKLWKINEVLIQVETRNGSVSKSFHKRWLGGQSQPNRKRDGTDGSTTQSWMYRENFSTAL